ncbi:inorganic triphosphatase [Shimwellia pseudoproteus]|uniref:CYTH domain-containing protein n=1 Tax=Shimwellia pseudoproteus TaxID=570012 RepID=UPI0018EBD7D2|nr:inorganic triphosphatase [Shimwellia pseudoproteus]MBJ3814228.1 inorganic triphosphatase [Shimwellia pseudoproteus]
MSQEIELKFIVESSALDNLRALLNGLDASHSEPRNLLNVYYETPDCLLRRHDMGLRVRGDNGHYEMTMKTAGHTVGGLHQRPEYNIPLETPDLALGLFPAEMWPGDLDADTVSASVAPLFSTNFAREKWLITHGESRIEIALDLGEVCAGEFREPISELEMEILSGNTADLLALARQLTALAGLRQGSLSKAARGYHLARGNTVRPLRDAGVLHLPAKSTVEQGLIGALELALAHWQYHEELWVRGNEQAREPVLEAIAMVRHVLALFGGIIPRKASAHLRDQLMQCEASLQAGSSPVTLAWSPQFSSAKLALTDWLVSRGWLPFVDEKGRQKLGGSFKRFADIQLSRHAAELRQAFLHSADSGYYQQQLIRLARELDAIRMLAGHYDDQLTQPWLETWQQLRQAISHHQSVETEHWRGQAIALVPFWLHSGK